jgi:hypothetical protein
MRLAGSGQQRRGANGPGRRPAGGAVVFAAAFLFAASGGPALQERPSPPGPVMSSDPAAAEGRQTGQYGISAHVFFLGNLGDAGSMTIESTLQKKDGRLEKTLRMAGGTNAEQIKKNRDYSGEFKVLKTFPLRSDGSVDEPAAAETGGVESSSSGFLKTNKKTQAERMTFFPDHTVVVRNDGPETRVEGSYGCILAPLEYLMEHDIKVGEVIDTPFILKGIPRIFRMEVTGLTTLSSLKARAYEIVLYAIEKTAGPDRAPKDVWRKKGNLRIWFCKEGPYRNQMVRMKIKFRWYLSILFDLKKPASR